MATANPDTSNTSDKHNDDNQDKDEENNEAEKSFEVICIRYCCVDDWYFFISATYVWM